MPNFGMAEQYGINCDDVSEGAWRIRSARQCPFAQEKCSKKGGVCSITDGTSIAIVCPSRFVEDNLLYETVSNAAFGETSQSVAVKEVRFLRSTDGTEKAVGNIDNVIVRTDGQRLIDWCALEVQAVYFSGMSMRAEIEEYETVRHLPQPASRRPDFRSSAPKRLLPQLETKVPTLRRWGKKMFVAVDEAFYGWMPQMEEVGHITNADVCWVVFGLDRSVAPYKLRLVKTALTTLEESRRGLVAGLSPDLPTFESSLLKKTMNPKSVVWRGPA